MRYDGVSNTYSESILNGKFNARINRLYRCQSKIVFIIMLDRNFVSYQCLLYLISGCSIILYLISGCSIILYLISGCSLILYLISDCSIILYLISGYSIILYLISGCSML